MRKFGIFLLFVAVAVVITSIYGVVHHQLTFSASPEYYTKFKFIQTNLADSVAAQHMTQPRSAVVIAAVKTSYPIGLAIGVVLGLVALVFPTTDTMFPSALQALGLILVISAAMALFCYYSTSNAHMGSGIYDPLPIRLPDLANKQAFLRAASLQYGILLGYVVGGAASLIFLIVKNGHVRRRLTDNDIPSGGA